MNPFEEINDITNITNITNNTIITKESKIEIWVEINGRKKNTYVSGWNISEDQLKEYLREIKKKNGCNGTIKTISNDTTNELITVMQLQGDHINYMFDFLIHHQIESNSIRIKG